VAVVHANNIKVRTLGSQLSVKYGANCAGWEAVIPGSFATLKVGDPRDTTQPLLELFAPPASETQHYWARTYEAADWRRCTIEPNAYQTLASASLIGGVGGQRGLICISSCKDEAAIQFSIKPPGLDFYYLSFLQEGYVELGQSRAGTRAQLDTERAAIFRAQSKTELHASDGGARLSVLLPVGLVRRHAALLLHALDVGDIDFETTIDCRDGAGASLRRLTEFLFSELARPDSLFAGPGGAALTEKLLVHAILMGLSDNRPALLRRQNSSAAPGNIRRAEEFIRSNADEATTVESVARAAGCSVRALQLGFRRFRNTTPMSALRRARLERARNEIVRSDGSLSVIDVAARHGFGNAGRFSDIYRHAFGEYPSETLRVRSRAPR
jgi:AraC-like DNA-binding protein